MSATGSASEMAGELVACLVPNSLSTLPLNFHAEYVEKFAIVVENIMTASECTVLTESAAGSFEEAFTNNGGGNLQKESNFRRSLQKDLFDPCFSASLFKRLQDADVLPLRYRNHILTRIHPNLHFLRYTDENFFLPHKDGHYAILPADEESTFDYDEISLITIQIYLTDTTVENGGQTRFLSPLEPENQFVDVLPAVGKAVIFDHGILHEGCTFTSTEKDNYKDTVRLEVMYAPDRSCTDIPHISISGVIKG